MSSKDKSGSTINIQSNNSILTHLAVEFPVIVKSSFKDPERINVVIFFYNDCFLEKMQ